MKQQMHRRNSRLDYYIKRGRDHKITDEAKRLTDSSIAAAQHLHLSAPTKSRELETTQYCVSDCRGNSSSASGIRASMQLSEDRQTIFVVGRSDVAITCTCFPASNEDSRVLHFPCKHAVAVLIRMGKLSLIYDHTERFYHEAFLVAPIMKALQDNPIDSAFHVIPTPGKAIVGPVPLVVSKSALGHRIPSRSAGHLGQNTKRTNDNKARKCTACGSELHDRRKCTVKHVAPADRAQFLADQTMATSVANTVSTDLSTVVSDVPLRYPNDVQRAGEFKRARILASTDEDHDEMTPDSASVSAAVTTSSTTSFLYGLVRSIFAPADNGSH